MRPLRNYFAGCYCHVTVRGNNQQDIFQDNKDRLKYLSKVEENCDKYSISVLCYVLMTNHVHLLLRQNGEIPISKFMQSLNTSYSLYFNLKHKRTGHLFQGRFYSVFVDTDEYLLHLSRYIHLNPVVGGLVKQTEDYPWSSYDAYLGKSGNYWLNKNSILNYFSKNNPGLDYKNFVDAGIPENELEMIKPLVLE